MSEELGLSVSHTIGELPSDTQESACCVLLKCRFKMHQKAALNLQGHPNWKYIKSKYKISEVKSLKTGLVAFSTAKLKLPLLRSKLALR